MSDLKTAALERAEKLGKMLLCRCDVCRRHIAAALLRERAEEAERMSLAMADDADTAEDIGISDDRMHYYGKMTYRAGQLRAAADELERGEG